MADTKISALDAAASATVSDETVVNESGTTKKVSLSQIQTLFRATQAQQETGTSDLVFITPAVQHFSDSAAKFWVKAIGNSTTILASYNMTSWADTATGKATGTIATVFSSGNWAGLVDIIDSTSAWDATYSTGYGFATQAAGTFEVDCARIADGNNAVAALVDPESWFVTGFGDI